MTSSRKSLLLATLLASATFASAGAFAQAQPGVQQPGAQPQAEQRHNREDRAQRFERVQKQRAERLSALKEKLKLTPAQEGAWSSFASAQQPPARPAGQARAEFAKLTTPQRLDRMQARQAERSAMFAKRADATRSFYAALTPEQQKTFDAESMARFGDHGGPRHHPNAASAKS
ncbi:Spy/CpxP family protein refolding chaperone [Variovorax sp. GT1P44]|uniref:Spy/CpxP family protein refolding chaperone n=1 Tax=Variovorax sp. GT1P44 TaxID=3443742 RepID=UPI003F47E37F